MNRNKANRKSPLPVDQDEGAFVVPPDFATAGFKGNARSGSASLHGNGVGRPAIACRELERCWRRSVRLPHTR
ncbi:MAG TPA: hypothetical protein VNK95_08895, partial [Caldilineaceae bacterium]|nr:hypothetical protein [Caldilineaceae bacterium]